MDEAIACGMCTSAYTDSDLNSDNDLSYFVIGMCGKGFRIVFRSGASRPTDILFERHFGSFGWHNIGFYRPKYCPNCGRELRENNLFTKEVGKEAATKK